MQIKYAYFLVMVAAIGFVAAGVQADLTRSGDEFTQAVNDNWAIAGNWWYSEEGVGSYPGWVPDGSTDVVIGSPDNTPVSCTIYSGTNAICSEMDIGGYKHFGVDYYTGTGTLIVQAGASLWVDGSVSRLGGGAGNDGSMGRLEVYGTMNLADMLNVGEYGRAQLVVGSGASVTTGRVNFGHGNYMSDGYSYEATVGAGATWTNNGGGFYVSGGVSTSEDGDGTLGPHVLTLEDGVVINASFSGYTGQSFWHMGGTIEIAGQVTLNVSGAPCNFGKKRAMPPPALEASPVLKFTGYEGQVVLTTTGMGYDVSTAPYDMPGSRTAFLDDGGPTCFVDVSELVPTHNDWETIVQTEEMLPGSVIDFVPGTDPTWEIRLTDGANGKIEVRWNIPPPPFQLGDMDGSDGAVEPNGNDINPFVLALVDRPAYEAAFPGLDADARGDCAQDDGLLNGNDIYPFVCMVSMLPGSSQAVRPGSLQAVPEPASALLLLAGFAGMVRRRRKR